MLDLINQNGKILFMGSLRAKEVVDKFSEELQQKFRDDNLTKDQITELQKEYFECLANDNITESGWYDWAYAVSKLFLLTYSRWLGQKNPTVIQKHIQVYNMSPGFVRTDMSQGKGDRSVEEGCKTALWLIELPFEIMPDLQGKFVRDCELMKL